MPENVSRSDRGDSPPSRSAVIRKIEEAHDAAVREILQEAKLSDARTMHAIQRIKQLAVSAFIELDELYRTFEALQKEPDRSSMHQQWSNERISSLLLQTERAMGEVVSSSLRQIGAEIANPKPKEARKEVIVREVAPDWLKFVKKNQDLL
jgi:hypothetical protein